MNKDQFIERGEKGRQARLGRESMLKRQMKGRQFGEGAGSDLEKVMDRYEKEAIEQCLDEITQKDNGMKGLVGISENRQDFGRNEESKIAQYSKRLDNDEGFDKGSMNSLMKLALQLKIAKQARKGANKTLLESELKWEQMLNKQKPSNDYGEDLRLKHTYSKTFKEKQGAYLSEAEPQDPYFQFLRACQLDNNLALPLLSKVRRKTLILQNYTLSIGHCRALAAACPLLPRSINRVFFENCGIDDAEFASILKGLAQLTDFKSVIYKRNIFDSESLDSIIPLLRKRLPNHLEELRLINCQIPQRITGQLLQQLQFKSQLKKLGLVGFPIGDTAFRTFTAYFRESKYLKELDLTDCSVGLASFKDFFCELE